LAILEIDWGLGAVPTSLWGGILVTMLVATVGIVFSLPFGILLALGRRSKLPLVRLASVIFIEFVRGVPLITVLIMANTMLPLFLPGNITVIACCGRSSAWHSSPLPTWPRWCGRPAGDAEGPI
jgi:general L-amino acid transport system permease protein